MVLVFSKSNFFINKDSQVFSDNSAELGTFSPKVTAHKLILLCTKEDSNWQVRLLTQIGSYKSARLRYINVFSQFLRKFK